MEKLDPSLFSQKEQGKELEDCILFFTSKTCPPCRQVEAVLDCFSDQLVSIFEIDWEDTPILAIQFEIRGIPALVILRNGIEAHRLIGWDVKYIAKLLQYASR